MSDPKITFGRTPEARTYLIGLGLALVLTAIPFALVYFHLIAGAAAVAAIAIAAAAQIVVHLRTFLHIGLRETPGEYLLTLALAGILIFVMVGGSLWIMFDLNARMGM